MGAGPSSVPDLVHTMRSHPHDAEAQCEALKGLAYPPPEEIPAAQQALAEARGVGVILAALQQFPSHEGVQLHGCAALMNAALRNAALQEAIRGAGGVGAVVAAMTRFAASDDVQVSVMCIRTVQFFSVGVVVGGGYLSLSDGWSVTDGNG